MKQLTIYCSEELSEQVSQTLHHFDLDGFMHMPGVYGTKLKPKGSFEKDLSWEANAFVVFPGDEQLPGLLAELKEIGSKCGEGLCLRMVVVEAEQIV